MADGDDSVLPGDSSFPQAKHDPGQGALPCIAPHRLGPPHRPQSQPLADVCCRLHAGDDGALSQTELAGAESQLLEVLRLVREARAEAAARAPSPSTIAASTAFYNLGQAEPSEVEVLVWALGCSSRPGRGRRRAAGDGRRASRVGRGRHQEGLGWATGGPPRPSCCPSPPPMHPMAPGGHTTPRITPCVCEINIFVG